MDRESRAQRSVPRANRILSDDDFTTTFTTTADIYRRYRPRILFPANGASFRFMQRMLFIHICHGRF